VQVISLDLRTNLSRGIGVKCRKNVSETGEHSDQTATPVTEDVHQIPNTQDTESEEVRYVYILNRVLPPDIRVLAWCPVDPAFTARFSCTSRTYKYFFPRGNLNLTAMKEAATALVGEHDFRNLCKMDVGNGVVTFRRYITAVDLTVGFDKRTGDDDDDDDDGDGYEICELTITGQAFLWHQIRCIVTVLFLTGQGRENPAIVSELLDVERHPRKPQYAMAAEFPLILFDCAYDNDDIEWRRDADSDADTVRSFQAVWTRHRIRAAMLRRMMSDLGSSARHQTDCLVPGSYCRSYKPLLERDLCESLEDRIGHYAKKQKLTCNDKKNGNRDTQVDRSDTA